MPRPAGTCLVMLSGGIDSTVLLYELLAFGEKPVALTYLSKNAEVRAATEIADCTGVPHIVLDQHVELVRLLNAATFSRFEPKDHFGQNSFPHICSLANSIVFASLLFIPRVLWGWRRSEMHAAEQPDRYPDFLGYISHMNRLRDGPSIEAPFFERTKQEVVQMGIELGVPIERTYSCIRDQSEPCGACRRCLERHTALDDFL
jgi:7-cyano-7-deazaguanine synthase